MSVQQPESDRRAMRLRPTPRPTVIVVGQTPPPYHGQAIMIASLVTGLQEAVTLRHVRMHYSNTMDEVGRFAFIKLWHLLIVMVATAFQLLRHRDAILYYPPAGPHFVPVVRDLLFLTAMRPLARKVIFHFHTIGVADYIQGHRYLRRWGRWAYAQAQAAIVLGESNRRDAEQLGATQIFVIPNGIDVAACPVRRPPHNPIRLLYVGIHDERKGIRDIIATLQRLQAAGVAVQANLVGEWWSAEEEAICRRLVRDGGLEKIITFHGRLIGAAKWQQYAANDLFFFPTVHPDEAFGVVLIEALAYGLPVIATRWRGPGDIVVDQESGFLHPAHDIAAFADSIVRLARDPILYQSMSQAARRRYEQHYTGQVYLARLTAAFEAVAAEGRDG